jgi:hypothetical protein
LSYANMAVSQYRHTDTDTDTDRHGYRTYIIIVLHGPKVIQRHDSCKTVGVRQHNTAVALSGRIV